MNPSRYHISGDEAGSEAHAPVMANGTLGKTEEFDSAKEEWQQYEEGLDHFSLPTASTARR